MMTTTTIPYTLHYQRAGTKAPVFLAGTFTNPEWLPQEMQSKTDGEGGNVFWAELQLEPGRNYRYKFRVGNEDAWVLDEHKPIVTDDMGDMTNALVVSAQEMLEANNLQGAQSMQSATQTSHDGMERNDSPVSSALKWLGSKIGATERDEGTSTPIEEVASTAAEVANTAEKLDAGDSPAPLHMGMSESEGEHEEDLKTPLFAHECFGAAEFVDDGLDHKSYDTSTQLQKSRSKSIDESFSLANFNDPTLEKFPSDKSSVLNALRKIQSSVDDHQIPIENLHSPHTSDSAGNMIDSSEDHSSPPSSLSPTSTKKREHRLSHCSSGRNRSAVSLGSIAEEPKAAKLGGDYSRSSASPPIDEAETLMMK